MKPRQLDAAAALVQGRDDFAVLPTLWKVGSAQVHAHWKLGTFHTLNFSSIREVYASTKAMHFVCVLHVSTAMPNNAYMYVNLLDTHTMPNTVQDANTVLGIGKTLNYKRM